MTNYSLLLLAFTSGDRNAVAKAIVDARDHMCVGACPIEHWTEGKPPCEECALHWLEQEAIETSKRDTKNFSWSVHYTFSKRDPVCLIEKEEGYDL